MGGGAFRNAASPGQPTLNTPRMTPAEYQRLKNIYLAKVQAYFADSHAKVAILREAPEKVDYGDIDLFVGLDEDVEFLRLANEMGARGLIIHSTGAVQNCTVGVPKDESSRERPAVLYQTTQSNSSSRSPSPAEVTPEDYAQIDITIIPTDLVDWHTFYSAYGDLNGLLGHIITNLGFTITDRGLWLRMKELDVSKNIERTGLADSEGKLMLSKDPAQVMRFLGLSVDEWDAGFSTLHSFYSWLGACRVLHPVAIKLKRDKAHERIREQKRDVYRRFFFEWLPAHVPEMNETFEKEEQVKTISELRERYLQEAIDFFDKRAIYEMMHKAAVLKIRNAVAENVLRPLVAKHSGAKAKKLPEMMRAFRRFVVFDQNGRPVVAETAHTDAESQLHLFLDDKAEQLRDEIATEEFVKRRWEELKAKERLRAKGKSADEAEAEMTMA